MHCQWPLTAWKIYQSISPALRQNNLPKHFESAYQAYRRYRYVTCCDVQGDRLLGCQIGVLVKITTWTRLLAMSDHGTPFASLDFHKKGGSMRHPRNGHIECSYIYRSSTSGSIPKYKLELLEYYSTKAVKCY